MSGKIKKLEVTEEELALLQCAIVHCDMFWQKKKNGKGYVVKDRAVQVLLDKIVEPQEKRG